MMKKFLLWVILMLLPIVLTATPMNVVGEVFTSTSCGYCPSARQGLRDLSDNFDNFIPLFWQFSSGYVGMPSPNFNSRAGMYGLSSIPYARFGGYLSIIGGQASGSMYSSYLPKYNTIDALESPLSIDITMDVSSKSTLDIQADVEVTGSISTSNNRIILLLTYKYSDDYTCAVVAYHDETFDLTSVGQTETYTTSFGYDSDWDLLEVKAVAIVQTFSSNYKILQAATCGVNGVFSIFSSNIQSGPPELGVQFYNESYPATGVTFEWDFDGDGTWDSTEENPYHLYDTIGTYDVSLRISDGAETATTTVEDYIKVTNTSNITGELSGVWTEAYSPYTITDNVILPDENMLEIGPNVEIHTNNASKITIEGYFSAIGEDGGNIIFTTDNMWSGLYFFNNDYENALRYAQITGAIECAVDICNSSVVVGHNTIYENTTTSQKGTAINVSNSDDVLIEWNTISNNTSTSLCGAISLDNSSPTIVRNLIMNNKAVYASAFSMKNESCPELINNTIANNLSSYAFYMFSSSNPTIENCIIRQTGDVFMNLSSTPIVMYSDLSDDYTGTGNISDDPEFVNPTAGDGPDYNGLEADWELQETSPCIDAGNPTSPHDPDSTIADMGALYYHHDIAVDDPEVPDMTIRSYPNPFNGETTISCYSKSNILDLDHIKIFNIKGELVRALELEPSATGFRVVWDGKDDLGKNVPSGIYLCRMASVKQEESVNIRKIMLLR